MQQRKRKRCEQSFSLVVPLDDDATILLPSNRSGIGSDWSILARARDSDSPGSDSLTHEVLAHSARAVEAEHDIAGVRSYVVCVRFDADSDRLSGIGRQVDNETVEHLLRLITPRGPREIDLRSIELEKHRSNTRRQRRRGSRPR